MNKRQRRAWLRNQNAELAQLWEAIQKPVLIILVIVIVIVVAGLIGNADVHNLTLGQ